MTSSSPAPHRLVAFQHRDYRLQWFGQLVSLMGTQMQTTAIIWHIYNLLLGQTTAVHLFGLTMQVGLDKLALGGLGLVRIVPIILFAPFGGVVSDAFNRRMILIWSQVIAAVFAAILAWLTLARQETLVSLYLMAAAMSAVTAFSNPARQSLIPNLVPREHLTNAVSLNTLMWQISAITGPVVAGLVLANAGPGWVYVSNAVSFLFMLAALLLMRYRGEVVNRSATISRASLVEGIRFTFDSSLIRSTMFLDFFATFFSSATTMLPAVAHEILHTDVHGYALLTTAESVGAMLAGLALSLRKDIRHQGVVLLVSVGIYGAATALFGMSGWFALSYLLYALVGAGDTVSTVIRQTLRQVITPDHLRGRMTGVNMVFFAGGPQLGELEAGIVASLWGTPISIITGGVATVLLTLLVAWQYPSLRNYRNDAAEGARA